MMKGRKRGTEREQGKREKDSIERERTKTDNETKMREN